MLGKKMHDKMNAKARDVFDIFDVAFRNHFKLLKSSLGLIVCLTLSLLIVAYLPRLSRSVTLTIFIDLISSILVLFFSGAILYQAQRVLFETPVTQKQACLYMRERSPSFYLACFIYAVGLTVYCLAILALIHHWIGETSQATRMKELMALVFLLVIPVVVVMVMLMYTLPLVILDKLQVRKAFAASWHLTTNRMLPTFFIYVVFGIIYMAIMPTTRHAFFFMHYHVYWLYSFVVLCVLAPIFFNYYVLMLNDVKLRNA